MRVPLLPSIQKNLLSDHRLCAAEKYPKEEKYLVHPEVGTTIIPGGSN